MALLVKCIKYYYFLFFICKGRSVRLSVTKITHKGEVFAKVDNLELEQSWQKGKLECDELRTMEHADPVRLSSDFDYSLTDWKFFNKTYLSTPGSPSINDQPQTDNSINKYHVLDEGGIRTFKRSIKHLLYKLSL